MKLERHYRVYCKMAPLSMRWAPRDIVLISQPSKMLEKWRLQAHC